MLMMMMFTVVDDVFKGLKTFDTQEKKGFRPCNLPLIYVYI